MKKKEPVDTYLQDESFQRWLNQSASAEEEQHWTKWLEQSGKHREIFNKARNVWQSGYFNEKARPDVYSAWQRLDNELIKKEGLQRLRQWFPWRFAVAAMALCFIALLAYRYWHVLFPADRQTLLQVNTQFNEQRTIHFADGSSVVLNARSMIRYFAGGFTGKRQVYLDGEAYFIIKSVAGEKASVFTVNTPDGAIRVLGTRFTVHSRQGTQVILEKGKLEIAVRDSLQPAAEVTKATLSPGQMVHFSNGKAHLKVNNDYDPLFLSWWKDRFIFRKTRFELIKQRLEETYDVEIRVGDPSLLKRTVTGSIEKDDLDVIIKAIALILNVDYRVEGRIIRFGDSSKL